IFYGLTRFGYYLDLYYDLYAAMSKLRQLYLLPAEIPRQDRIQSWQPTIRFEVVRCTLAGGPVELDLELAAGSLTLMATRSNSQSKAIIDLLLNQRQPDSGRIMLGGHGVDDFDLHRLRDE